MNTIHDGGLQWYTQTYSNIVFLCRFLTLPGTRGTQRQRRLLCTCICTALLSWIAHTHLVPLSVTKRLPVHFILNPGHVEYELGVLMVWKLSRPDRDSNEIPLESRVRLPLGHSAHIATFKDNIHISVILLSIIGDMRESRKISDGAWGGGEWGEGVSIWSNEGT